MQHEHSNSETHKLNSFVSLDRYYTQYPYQYPSTWQARSTTLQEHSFVTNAAKRILHLHITLIDEIQIRFHLQSVPTSSASVSKAPFQNNSVERRSGRHTTVDTNGSFSPLRETTVGFLPHQSTNPRRKHHVILQMINNHKFPTTLGTKLLPIINFALSCYILLMSKL
jgi:hypothetical protein